MLEPVLALLAGLLIGSFLNVCIYRMPRDLSVVAPRSFCPNCEHPVAWYDNVPLLSYAVLRGRCRHCAKPIALRYLLVEAVTGALFFFIVLKAGPTVGAAKLCVFSALIVGLMFADLEERILPDQFTLGGVVLGLAFAALAPVDDGFFSLILPPAWGRVWLSVAESAAGALVPSLLMWLLGEAFYRLRKKEGLGLGDVKMVAMIGAFLGLPGAITTVMAGSIVGSIIGLIYIYGARKDAGSYELPFGTFLGAGALAVALWSLH